VRLRSFRDDDDDDDDNNNEKDLNSPSIRDSKCGPLAAASTC